MLPTDRPEVLLRAVIVMGIVVLMVRLFVGLTAPRRVHRVWTFGLPIFAMLCLFLRVVVLQYSDVFVSEDWSGVAAWGFVVLTQLVATVYQYVPVDMASRRGVVDGRD